MGISNPPFSGCSSTTWQPGTILSLDVKLRYPVLLGEDPWPSLGIIGGLGDLQDVLTGWFVDGDQEAASC